MDVEGLLDVGYDEIVVTTLCTSCDGCWGAGWKLADALDGFDVVEPFRSGERGPE
jgi:hypothetical protein